MKKKLLVCTVMALLCCIMFAVSVSADTEGIYSYIALNNKVTITRVNTTAEGDIVIPSKLGGYPVTDIGNNAFDDCTKVTSVIVPSGVKKIGDYAFRNCKLMTSITLPQGITSIGNYAFYDCLALESITLPTTLKTIGSLAFWSCDKLTEVTVPQGTSMGSGVFYGCDLLASVSIPEGVTVIGSFMFGECPKLTTVSLPNSVTAIDSYAFYYCSSLKSIILPTNLLTIGDYAFRHCSKLTSITLPNGVTSVGEYAFSECTLLSGIAIPSSVTSIGTRALAYRFSYSSTTNYYYPISGLTIYGYTGSYAERYAKNSSLNGHTGSATTIPFYSLGDVAEPVFVTDLSDTSCMVGETLTLSVLANSASDGEITYQWYVSDTPDDMGTAIDGATGTSYTVPTQSPSVRYYYVIATNTNGENVVSTIGSTAKITVGAGTAAASPVIYAQTSSLTCPVGDSAALFVSASVADGGALSYQWYSGTSEDGTYTPINGATDAGYLPSAAAEGTTYYYVTVTNTNASATGAKTAAVRSNVMALTVGAKASYTISGTLITYGDEADVTIDLLQDGVVIRTITVENTTGSIPYLISGVEAGSYDLRVSKPDHVTREYPITVDP